MGAESEERPAQDDAKKDGRNRARLNLMISPFSGGIFTNYYWVIFGYLYLDLRRAAAYDSIKIRPLLIQMPTARGSIRVEAGAATPSKVMAAGAGPRTRQSRLRGAEVKGGVW